METRTTSFNTLRTLETLRTSRRTLRRTFRRTLKSSKTLETLLLSFLLTGLLSCSNEHSKEETGRFYIDKLCPYTPIKDQGQSNSCWIYAMLATIESNRIAMGDSVNISPTFFERRVLEEEADQLYRNHGKGEINDRAMIPHLLTIMEKYGALAFNTYHRKKAVKSMTVLTREVEKTVLTAVKQRQSLQTMRRNVKSLLDRELGVMPYVQFMYGMEYTYKQFGRSILLPGEYTVYGIDKQFPDHRPTDKITPCSQEELFRKTLDSLKKGLAVCWEGDITKENFSITDDHCMAIVGLAHNRDGEEYFICKNSWGTNTPHKGMRFMSFKDFKKRTICIAVKER